MAHDDANLERFLTHPTYVGYRDTEPLVRPEWAWEKPDEGTWLTIVFNNDTGTVTVSGFPTTINYTSESETFETLSGAARRALTSHRRLAQRARHYPANSGLVQKLLREINMHEFQPVALREGTNAEPYTNIDPLIPTYENRLPFGWFAPDANPDVFGTPFLYATHTHPKRNGNGDVVWVLGLVGLANTPIMTAAWDDGDGCARLHHVLHNYGIEDLQTMAALATGYDDYLEARTVFAKETAIAIAADAWTDQNNRIESALVMHRAAQVASRTKGEIIENQSPRPLKMVVNLEKIRDTRTTAKLPQNIVAAVSVTVFEEPITTVSGGSFFSHISGEPVSESEYADLVDDLVCTIQRDTPDPAARLVRVVPAQCKQNVNPTHADLYLAAFYLVANPPLLAEHRDAFPIPENAAMHVYDDGVWVPLS